MYINVKEYKNKIYISELSQDYKIDFKVENKFQPELFVQSPMESEYKSLIDNSNLQKITFNSINEFKDYKWKMKDLDNGGLYADIPVEYQYIRKYYTGSTEYKTRFWFLDIETNVPKSGFPSPFETPTEITLIQIAESDTKTRYVLGWLNVYNIKEDEVYIYCASEEEMLQKFAELQLQRTPAITVAWNGDGFDFPYIINRTRKIGLNPEMYSPFGILEEHNAYVFGKHIKIEKPLGIVWVDEIEAYKKGDPSGKESWSLEYMSKFVLGEEEGGKLDYKKSGYLTMRDFINNNYNPELDEDENSDMKRVWDIINKDPNNEQAKAIFAMLHWRTFVEYGIIDVDVLKAMEAKKGNLNALVDLSQTMSVNIYDVFATVKPWQIHIWNELYNRNQFVPAKSPFDTYKIPGGHVFAKPGLYNWVCSFDVRSLYPFCMISLNMSPETYIKPDDVPKDLFELVKHFWRYREGEKETEVLSEDLYLQMLPDEKEKITKLLVKYDLCMAPNGSFYKKEKQGILPELTQFIYNSRNHYKKEKKSYEKIVEQKKKNNENYNEEQNMVQKSDTRQYTKKIQINAEYGFIANSVANIANSDLAGGITAYGRYNLKKTGINIISKLNKINPNFKIEIAQMDTDSFYLCFDTVVQEYVRTNPTATDADITEFLDQFCKKVVSSKIQEISSEIAIECNAREDEILWDREIISKSFISSGKKRYACSILDDEGTRLTKPKKKIVGLEIKRSSTPSDVKEKLGSIIDLIFAGDNEALVLFIEKYKEDYPKIDINKVAIPTGVSELDKFIEDSSLTMPWHVRASIVYNNYIRQSGLDYPLIVNGDKIKIVYLKKNPVTNSETMAFLDSRFLEETGIIQYVDYNLMFEKSFMSPVETLTNIVSWKTSLNSALMDLF